ncbi:hypothetical protein [Thalassobaculum sp.]|uniref:hypothetical protein n=1 Tax=Thalassobaculum sp. TaxID=2022740 RepID=UPI0032EF15DD
MRWLLFDLVVGAALVWLVWAPGPADRPPVPAPAAVPPVAETPDPADRLSPPFPRVQPDDVATPMPGEPADPNDVQVDSAPTAPATDRGRRLRALARDAEALFLRGRE